MNWQEILTILVPIFGLMAWVYSRVEKKADARQIASEKKADERQIATDKRLETIEKRLERIEEKIDSLNTRLTRLEVNSQSMCLYLF